MTSWSSSPGVLKLTSYLPKAMVHKMKGMPAPAVSGDGSLVEPPKTFVMKKRMSGVQLKAEWEKVLPLLRPTRIYNALQRE
jgi:hypothetical protein